MRASELQKLLHAGGFAGICFPREYGGLGLPTEYQKAFDAESRDYEKPLMLNTPSFTICAATILDTGSEDQKRDRISAALRGDEIFVQLLSEPNGGSDLAGVITRADRRDGTWVVNGAKTWSTSALAADYGPMLARRNWTVPKHEGLTMFLVPINAPGITMRRIKQVDGRRPRCALQSGQAGSILSVWVFRPGHRSHIARIRTSLSSSRLHSVTTVPTDSDPRSTSRDEPAHHRYLAGAGRLARLLARRTGPRPRSVAGTDGRRRRHRGPDR